MGRRPHFFKPFFASRSSRRLTIPPGFRKHISPYINRRIILRGPGGRTWTVHVEIDGVSGDVIVQRGWNRFVSDHALQSGDFLVFEHCGRSIFAVVIFDPSLCEKKVAILLDDHDVTQSRLGSRVSNRRKVMEEEKRRALECASSFQSQCPFAILVMRDLNVYHSYYLDLPRLLVEHLPRKSLAMRLQGPSGEAWKVSYVYYKGCSGLSAGWGLFATAHQLERDDVVIFELVRPFELRVHIYRVVEEIPLLCSG